MSGPGGFGGFRVLRVTGRMTPHDQEQWVSILRAHASASVRGAVRGLRDDALLALVVTWQCGLSSRAAADSVNVDAFVHWAVSL